MNLQAIDSEKRQFSRISFDAPVVLKQGNQKWESKLLDISLKGVLISKPDNWNEPDGNFDLEIRLDNSDIEIDMEVNLAHSENDHIGFHCEHIDIDSVTALRRLVELNLADEELLEREISNMLVS
jgi:PilZ domain